MLLDIEITLNNRPLKYLQDDIQLSVLTPNTLGFGEKALNLEEDTNMIERDLRKRAKYGKKCNASACNRLKGECLKSIQNRNLWRLGVVIELFKGKNGTVRAAKIRCGKSELERAVKHLYPLDLHYHWKYNDYIKTNKVNDDGQEQKSRRSKISAAAIPKMEIKGNIEDEQGLPAVE